MPKIRTLKAGYFSSEDTSMPTRETWPIGAVVKVLGAGLICAMADDEGRFKTSPTDIKAEIFRHDAVTEEQIGEALSVLDRTGFVHLYQVDGKLFGLISNWTHHQPIPATRFQASRLPAPPQARHKHATSTAQASSRHDADATHPERKGKERKGREGKGGAGEPATPVVPLSRKTETMTDLLLFWHDLTGGRPYTAREEEAASRIEVMAQKYPMAQVKELLTDRVAKRLAENRDIPQLQFFEAAIQDAAIAAVDGRRPAGHTGAAPLGEILSRRAG